MAAEVAVDEELTDAVVSRDSINSEAICRKLERQMLFDRQS